MPWIGAIDRRVIESDSDEDDKAGPVGNPIQPDSDIESDSDEIYDPVGKPVLADRHGFMLAPGNTVTKIADGTRFVVTTVERFLNHPIVWMLDDGNNASVSAMTVMLDDTERDERASYCRHCENHFNASFEYFDWQRGCGRCT